MTAQKDQPTTRPRKKSQPKAPRLDEPVDHQPEPIALEAEPTTVATVQLDHIKAWSHAIREPDAPQTLALRLSIRDHGLLEPLVVDSRNVLVAGSHRLAAIKDLRESDPAIYKKRFPGGMVPVNRLAFDADEFPIEAIAASVAENQKRQALDADAIKRIKEHLQNDLSIHFGPGRPKNGQRAASTILSEAFKRSPRQIRAVDAKSRKGQGSADKGSNKPGGGSRVSVDRQPVEVPAELLPEGMSLQRFQALPGFRRAQHLLLGLQLSDADFQEVAEWCQLPRDKRKVPPGGSAKKR